MKGIRLNLLLLVVALIVPGMSLGAAAMATAPQSRVAYEGAYVDGTTVTVGASPAQASPALEAQTDFFLVVYPIGWETLGIGTPLCNPCDHGGNGIDPSDFHDHVLGAARPSTGGGYTPQWHLFVVQPAYTGNAAHDAQVTAAYAGHLPAKSAAAVMALVAAKLNDGSAVATLTDTNSSVHLTVVNDNASH